MRYDIEIFGLDSSAETMNARKQLDSLGIDHRYINLEQAPERADDVEIEADGTRILPMIEMSSDLGRRRLSAPDRDELDSELHRFGIVEKGRANVTRRT